MATVRKASTMRTFETWTYEEVEIFFGLKKVDSLVILENWLAKPQSEVTEEERLFIKYPYNLLRKNINDWNEDELKMNFIGPFLVGVNYFEEKYKSFSQRKLSTTINNIFIGGVVDYVIASGKQKPRHPFFCLHEYKRPRRTVSPFWGDRKSVV